MILLTASGWWWGVSWFSKTLKELGLSKNLARSTTAATVGLIFLAYAISFGYFWRTYTLIYPTAAASHWQYGYEEAIEALEEARATYPDHQIYLSDHQGRPLMYYWFFTQADPRQVQAASKTAPRDQSELLEFDQIKVIRLTSEIVTRPSLALISPEQAIQMALAENNSQMITEINSARGIPIWQLWKLE